MEQGRSSRAAKQAATREGLLDAAATVFAQRGYEAAGIEQIAELAGYSHGAVYSNFKGKEELFLAVFERYMSERVRELSLLLQAPGSFAERTRAAADQWMERFQKDPDTFLLHLEFMIHAARNPGSSAPLGERMAAVRHEIGQRIDAEQASTGLDLPMPAKDLALIFRALGIGLAVEALNQPERIDPRLYGDFVALVSARLQETAGPPA